MEKSQEDVLAYAPFPEKHRRKIWSNKPWSQEGGHEENQSAVAPSNEEAMIRFVGSACANSTPSGKSLSTTSAQDLWLSCSDRRS
jgi:hypothetical protein